MIQVKNITPPLSTKFQSPINIVNLLRFKSSVKSHVKSVVCVCFRLDTSTLLSLQGSEHEVNEGLPSST